MKTVRPKPTSLRPLSVMHRRWFWALMIVAVIVIGVGWTITIRDILQDVPVISTQMQASIEQAAQELEEANIGSPVGIDQTKEALEALQTGYEVEKARQNETYDQENITNATTP